MSVETTLRPNKTQEYSLPLYQEEPNKRTQIIVTVEADGPGGAIEITDVYRLSPDLVIAEQGLVAAKEARFELRPGGGRIDIELSNSGDEARVFKLAVTHQTSPVEHKRPANYGL